MRYFQINNKIIDEKIKQFFETCFLQLQNYRFFVRKRFIKGNNEIGIVYEKCFELLEDN